MPSPAVTSLSDFALSINPLKLTGYLLNPQHPKGAAKAAFFDSFGYTLLNVDELMDALADHARADTTIITCRDHPLGFGVEIAAVGPLRTPIGRQPLLKAAWNWRTRISLRETTVGLELATFVSAYPA